MKGFYNIFCQHLIILCTVLTANPRNNPDRIELCVTGDLSHSIDSNIGYTLMTKYFRICPGGFDRYQSLYVS